MRASRYFAPTLRDNPQEASIISHQLMLRSGMVQQIASGIYSWLPLGLRVLQKIENIVREEQNRAGALEILMPTIQPAALWQESGRYDDYGQELLRIRDRHDKEMFYGPTAEEVVTFIFRTHVKSYRQLPLCLYNIQWKFRDEIRPRFGVMRGREFLMKDSYSFDLTPEAAQQSYKSMFDAYLRTFRRMGLRAIPVRANTGPIGGDLSHEFQIVAQTGESALYYDALLDEKECQVMEDYENIYAMADDRHNPISCPIKSERLRQTRGIEVGHVFYFGTKYSQPLQAFVTDAQGQKIAVQMGSYGIGVSRLVGALIEVFHDDKGICWPTSVAPYTFALAAVSKDPAVLKVAQDLYQKWSGDADELFFYDLERNAGEIFSDLDLIGFPYQIIIGKQWLDKGQVEIKERSSQKRVYLSLDELSRWQEAPSF